MSRIRPHLKMPFRLTIAVCAVALFISGSAGGQTATVSGTVAITRGQGRQKDSSNAGVVVWLTPTGDSASAAVAPAAATEHERFTLLQKDKTFEPHILVIPVGSEVDFPNKDPFFHNVFSLFEGKRFDLGLYESGSTRKSRFDRPGISYLFCNIHPEMSAVIIALDTRYYGTSNAAGQISIAHVPDGSYILHVWSERSSIGALKKLSRQIQVSGEAVSFDKLLVPDNASLPLTHKNKYGRDYENPTPPGQIYNQK